MILNQSDNGSSSNRTSLPEALNTDFMQHEHPHLTNGEGIKEFKNHYHKTQVLLSIALVALTTIWVQITVQRQGPFARTAQCFFNQAIFLHDSQDIYEGTDVIYWRNGETYSFPEIQGIFQRLNDTVQTLETDSLFTLPKKFTNLGSLSTDVKMMVIYRYDIPDNHHESKMYNFSLQEIGDVFSQTLLNKTFYEHLWKVQLQITIPIEYRHQLANMQLIFTCQIFSAMLMQYKMDVDILDQNLDLITSQSPYNEDQLGTRKLNDPHDLQLSIPYINWITLIIYMVVFLLEFRFINRKNHYIDQLIARKIKEENKIQRLLKKMDEKTSEAPKQVSDQFSFNVQPASQQESSEKEDKKQQSIDYQLSFGERLQKIGYYYILELAISFVSFFGYYNDHNGIICFFAWSKIVVYLAETKNRLMFGFLFEETIPTYLRIQFNILLWITAFVLFNMLVLDITKKFESLELGYYQYIFNYFQYGIYENWMFVFTPFGMLAQFFYFLQMMLLLYVGNNILISILANQVSKNSYLSSVEEMIDELKMQCPVCGTDFQSKKKGKVQTFRKEKLISKLIQDLSFEKMRASHDEHMESQYNIVIKSPNLSPYFPRKNQKLKKNDEFLSPQLKNRNLKDRLKEINDRMKEEDMSSASKLQAFEELKTKIGKQKVNIELSDSRYEEDKSKNKYHKKIRTKLELLFQKIDEFRQISLSTPRRSPLDSKEQENQTRAQILNLLLRKIDNLQQELFKKK